MRRHRFMYGKTLTAAGCDAHRPAPSLEGPTLAFRAVIAQLANAERVSGAAVARNAYLRTLTGLSPLLYRNDGEGP
jgi:hypothetical protein